MLTNEHLTSVTSQEHLRSKVNPSLHLTYECGSDKRVLRAFFSSFYVIKISKMSKISIFCLQKSQIASYM